MATRKERISEGHLVIPTLLALRESKVGWLSTSSLIEKLIVALKPDGEDAEKLDGRNDSRFSQIVRNMISHKTVSGNIIAEGYVEYQSRGLKITERGLLHLKNKGL